VGVIVVCQETCCVNRLTQWEFALCNFRPDSAHVLGDDDSQWSPHAQVTKIGNISELPNDHAFVVLAPANGTNIAGDESLVDFTHPTDVIYFFGSDAQHVEQGDLDRVIDHKVYVPNDSNDQMFSFTAYVVTAWDRRMKAT